MLLERLLLLNNISKFFHEALVAILDTGPVHYTAFLTEVLYKSLCNILKSQNIHCELSLGVNRPGQPMAVIDQMGFHISKVYFCPSGK